MFVLSFSTPFASAQLSVKNKGWQRTSFRSRRLLQRPAPLAQNRMLQAGFVFI
jgi:hypothetical protein